MKVASETRVPKAENQLDNDWGVEAREILKGCLEMRGWGYRELSEGLKRMNVNLDAPAVNRRINRGNFSAGFFLMCLEAMELRFEVLPAAAPGTNKRAIMKPIDALAETIGSWGKKSG